MSGFKFLLLLALLPLSLVVRANNDKEGGKSSEPMLHGFVSDASTKKPVQGVTVSISAKGQERREYTTDAMGNFKVFQIPAGEITIVLEKKGYKTFRRDNVVLKEGSSQKLNFGMCMMDDEEEAGDVFLPLSRLVDSE